MCATPSLLFILLAKQTVREVTRIFQRSVLVPLARRAVRHQSEKAALQIARFRFGVPVGLQFLLSVQPKLRPNAVIALQIMLPGPKLFSVVRPERFRAGFASVRVSDFML